MTNKPISEAGMLADQIVTMAARILALKKQSAEWERIATSNFEECAQMSQRITELEQQLAAERKDADRYRFLRNFLLVDDTDGREDCGSMYSLCINESLFDACTIGLPTLHTANEAIDAMIAESKRENGAPVEGE